MGRKKAEETRFFRLVFPKFWRWPWVCGQAANEVQSQVTSNGLIHHESNQTMTTIAVIHTTPVTVEPIKVPRVLSTSSTTACSMTSVQLAV